MKFEVLIVEPRSKQRLLLKNALAALPDVSNIRTCAGVDDIQPLVGLARANTITFLSDALTEKEILGILKADSRISKEQGLTLIISSRHELPRRFVSRLLLHGAHGFIIEPFSVFDLDSAINSARAFSRLPHAARVNRLLPMLIEDSFILVDEIAAAFYTGSATDPLLGELEDILDIADSEAERIGLPLYRYLDIERITAMDAEFAEVSPSPAQMGGSLKKEEGPEAPASERPASSTSPQVRRTTIRRT